eukprot:m51a1_g1429 putative small nucleolar ribonucleoprotein u3 component (183) ;mRNA; f:73247-74054
MVRKLKHHEQRLLKHADFNNWSRDQGAREALVVRRYQLRKREEYAAYNRLSGAVGQLVTKLTKMDPADPVRQKISDALVEKLYAMGLIANKSSLAQCAKINASSFCKRRLPMILLRLRMAQLLSEASQFVEQGHVRIGPEVVTDPAFLVTRNMEDFVTWVDTSKVRRNVLKYRDQLDDFDLL